MDCSSENHFSRTGVFKKTHTNLNPVRLGAGINIKTCRLLVQFQIYDTLFKITVPHIKHLTLTQHTAKLHVQYREKMNSPPRIGKIQNYPTKWHVK